MNNLLNNKWAWAVVILIILNFASIGFMWATLCKREHEMRHDHRQHMGQHPGGLMHKGHGGNKGDRDFLAHALSLTPEQKISFKKLKAEHITAMEISRKEMTALRKEVIQNLGKTEAEVEPVFQKIAALEMQNQKDAFKHFSEMYALCTDSQKVLLKEKLSNIISHSRPDGGKFSKGGTCVHKKTMRGKHNMYTNHSCAAGQPEDRHKKTKE